LTLGPQGGIANNVVQATFPGNTGFPAAFSASGKIPGDPAATTIVGVVLDNSNNPVPGATIRAFLNNVAAQQTGGLPPNVSAVSNAQGQFVIQPAPVGYVKIIADGSTVTLAGKWPNLEYELVTVSGATNSLGQPIYLLPLDQQHQLCVSSTQGGTLNLPAIPGFSLSVLPGAATFPGGSKTGCVTVTAVHPDKIPMSPGFGQQPRFIVTIQPAGTLFSPPAAITIPNAEGLKPREITEMYSFDHDLNTFVSVGTATVSDDGTLIRSDPGVGVLKAGWYCGGAPSPIGSAGVCPDCKKCNGTDCVPDPQKDNTQCTTSVSTPLRPYKGRCANGDCNPCPDSVTLVQPPAYSINLINQVRLGARTVGGIVVRMQISSPKGIDFDGNNNITEVLVPVPGSDCPSNFPNACTGGGVFTIGANEFLEEDSVPLPGQSGTFLDKHVSSDTRNFLAEAKLQMCTQVCTQTYMCNGAPIGTFTITRSFKAETIEGVNVTHVYVTKQ
jgi:hypothetical protein